VKEERSTRWFAGVRRDVADSLGLAVDEITETMSQKCDRESADEFLESSRDKLRRASDCSRLGGGKELIYMELQM